MRKKQSKRKLPTKKKDGSWDLTELYKSGKSPFNIEWIKYSNPAEGRDQIIFLYIDKETNKICKHRILR